MKANWANEFDPDRTVNRPFATSIDTTTKVPTMRMAGEQNIALAQGPGWKATELKYAGANGSPLSMTLILPDDLGRFEAGLSAAKLDAIQQAIAHEQKRIEKIIPQDDGDMNCPAFAYDVNLSLPKFGLDTRTGLVPILKAMGMRDAVNSNKADFSGITGGRDMFIANVIHQANIDVDETGTEAAAATAVHRRHDRRLRIAVRAEAQEAQLRPPVHVPDPRHEDRRDPVHGSRPRSVEALTPRPGGRPTSGAPARPSRPTRRARP